MTLKTISQLIPAEAVIVNDLFRKAVADEVVIYSRRGCALIAAVCSAVNVLGYASLLGARIISAVIHVKFDRDLQTALYNDANNLRYSFYFTVAATAYVFASLFTNKFTLEPAASLPPPPAPPLLDSTRVAPAAPPPPANLHDIIAALPVYTFASMAHQSLFLTAAQNWPQQAINGFAPYRVENTAAKIEGSWIAIHIQPNGRFLVPRSNAQIKSLLDTGELLPQADNAGPATPRSVKRALVPDSPAKAAPERETEEDRALREIRAAFREIYQPVVARHALPPKDQIYRHYIDEIVKSYGAEFVVDTANIKRLKESPLVTACNQLADTLTSPHLFDDGANQYIGFVALLRQAIALLTPEAAPACRKFIMQLSYLRFTGVWFYDYSTRFVELASGKLDKPLSIENFGAELGERNTAHNPQKMPIGLSMPDWDRNIHKMRGFFNRGFDPLHDRNVPYVDGIFTLQRRNIKVLRHGVPVSHNETLVVAAAARALHKGATWLAGWVISDPERYIGKTLTTGDLPQLNPDYRLFIQQAAAQGENILHVIFEDGDVHITGDESARVELRLSLQEEPNFFPVAFRVDGPFFKTLSKDTFTEFKTGFKKQLYGTLATTGFCIPLKVRRDADLDSHIDRLMQEAQDIYFTKPQDLSGSVTGSFVHMEGPAFKDLATQQAYMLLSYAHIVLFLADKLKISIIEAHCKDDIDRGNAFKAILKLHFLYLTGQVNAAKQLEKVLVQTLIPPVIVKRQGIISGRIPFILHVQKVMAEAFKRTAQPQLTPPIVGTYRVHRPKDHVQNQDLFPMGHTAKTAAEWWDFINHLKLEKSWRLPGFNGNFIDHVAAGPDFAQRDGIVAQIKKDVHRTPMFLGGEKITNSNVDAAFDRILPYLQSKGLSEADSWKVMCSFNQAFAPMTFRRMKALFKNEAVNVDVLQDAKANMENPEAGIYLDAEARVAKIRFVFFAQIVGQAGEKLESVKTTITVSDHRTGVAEFDFSICQS